MDYYIDADTKKLQNALADFELADQLIDIIRLDASENISKLFWREKGSELYLKAVEVCHLLNNKEKAYFFMEKWLADFAYRTNMAWWVFALAGVVAVAVAFLTVSFQSIKAAMMNPVKSIRME